jgi:hypothetical protein
MASDQLRASDGVPPPWPRRQPQQVAVVLAAAFALSACHLGFVTLTGLLPGRLADAGPLPWAITLAGFATAGLVLTDRTWAWRTAAALIVVFIGIGITRYEALLVPGLLTAVGWLQNDVHIGLLGLAGYLCLRRLRHPTC